LYIAAFLVFLLFGIIVILFVLCNIYMNVALYGLLSD